MRGATYLLPQYALIAWCSVKAQGQLYLYLFTLMSRSSSVSIETRLRLEDWGSILGRGNDGVLLFATASRSAPIRLAPGVQRPGREADHSLPSSAKVKMHGAIHPLPPYVFTAWFLVKLN
jgi:hypothetical protein